MNDFRPSRFQVLPSVVKNLVIINVLMAALGMVLLKAFHIQLPDYLALHYFRSPLFQPHQLITHLFMHGSPDDLNGTVLHLFSNMFALWMFGSVLENIWGPKRFFIFYMVCGVGAALCHLGVLAYQFEPLHAAITQYNARPSATGFSELLARMKLGDIPGFSDLRAFWNTNGAGCSNCLAESSSRLNQYYAAQINEATVGASGAVFGVLFAFGYLFPNTLLYFYFLVPIKAKWVVAGYIVFELYSGIRNSAGDNVAHFAHLGGVLVAFILLKIWNRTYRNQLY